MIAMGLSNRVRLRDMRDIYVALGECAELGADPVAWRKHLLSCLAKMLGAQVTIHTESTIVAPCGEPGWLRPVFVVDEGWSTESDRRSLERFMAEQKPENGPFVKEMFQPPVRLKVFHTYGQMGKAQWHESLFYNEFVRPAHLDDWFHAHHLSPFGQVFWVSANRALGDDPFTERQRRILKILFGEIVKELGNKLSQLDAPSVTTLSLRLQQVLYFLLEGYSEKQVASRLEISPHTVHQYVKDLYRRFQATSRGELLARTWKYYSILQSSTFLGGKT